MADQDSTDDPTIANEDPLWRRIFHRWWVLDKNLQPPRKRLSSQAFEDSKDGTPCSVHLGKDATAAGVSAESIMQRFPEHGMVSIPAGIARENGLGVVRHPDRNEPPNPEDPFHAYLVGDKKRKACVELGEKAIWLVRLRES
ncbi:MAG: hypothetical protein HUU06_02265 [Planctomycetaceae bacterium]|nr:hypothetical protein [Planctomycetota bacterium]NUN51597.1 hypothetical protein [Planctomycetaceae bacterium]